MLFEIGQRFVLLGVECRIVYLNQGKAWLAPIMDETLPDGSKLYKNCAFEVLDEIGRCRSGHRAQAIPAIDCGAV